jgi:hypothetical protein
VLSWSHVKQVRDSHFWSADVSYQSCHPISTRHKAEVTNIHVQTRRYSKDYVPNSRSSLFNLQHIRGSIKSLRTDRLKRELQMVQLSTTSCSCIAILWVSLVSFAAITLCISSQRVFVVVYFVIDSVRKLLDTPSYSGDQVSQNSK